MRPIALTVAAVLTLSAHALPAQMPTSGGPDSHSTVIFGVGGGVDVPTSHAANAFQNGWNGQAFLLVNLGILPELRFNFGFSKFDLKQTLTGSLADATGNGQIYGGVVGTRIPLIHGPVRPYLMLGVGIFNVQTALTPNSGGPEQSQSKVNWGVDGGAGLAINFKRVDAYIEGKIQNIYASSGQVVDFDKIQTVPVTMGIQFHAF